MTRRDLVLLGVLAALVRVVAFAELTRGPLPFAHEWDQSDMSFFHELAGRIVDGDPLLDGTYHPIEHEWRLEVARRYLRSHPQEAAALEARSASLDRAPETLLWDRWLGPKTYYQEPLYAYLLAAARRVFGPDVRFVFAAQLLVGVATVFLIALVAARYFGRGAGLAAGILAVGYAPLLFYELVLLRATFLACASVGLVFVAQRAIDREGATDWFLAGAGAGLAILLKSVFLPFALAVVVGAAVVSRSRPRQAATAAGAALGGIALALAPAVARNVVVGAPPFALASPGLANFAFGLGGALEPRLGSSAYDFASYVGIVERSGGAVSRGVVETLRTHESAWAFLRVVTTKFVHVWHWYEIPNNVNFSFYERDSFALRALPVRFLFVAPLAAIGLALARRKLPTCWPLLLAIAASLATLTVFAHNSRSRVALIPLLLPFAAFALVRAGSWLRGRRPRPLVFAFAASLAIAAPMARPLPEGRSRLRPADWVVALETYHLPRVAAAGEDSERAARVLRETLAKGPRFGRETAEIERTLAPIYAEIHRELASHLERIGAAAEAASHRDRARRLATN